MKINDYKTKELVEILNKGLKEGKSGVAICKELKIARSSILTRVKRDGYILDREKNRYVKEDEEVEVAFDEIEGEEINESEFMVNKQIEELKLKLGKNAEKKVDKKEIIEKPHDKEIEVNKKEEINTKEDTKKMKNKSDSLEKTYEEINISTKEDTKEVIKSKNNSDESSNSTTNSVVCRDEDNNLLSILKELENRIEILENKRGNREKNNITINNTKETTTRSIRLYKEVNDKLNKYLKKK